MCVDKTIYWRTETDLLAEQTQINPANLTTAWAKGTIIKPAYKKLIWSVPSVNTDMEKVPEPEKHKV